MSTEDKNQSLVEHLGELRERLIYAVAGIVVCTIGSFYFNEIIFDLIRHPIAPYLRGAEGGLIFTSPMDKFVAAIKVSIFSGIILASPFWLYQIWLFVAPGLYKKERKVGLAFMLFGTILFLCGVSFVYFFVYPIAFDFLLNFGDGKDVAMISIGDYLGFFVTTTLLFGLAFELPLFLTLLGMVGIIDKKFLAEKRRYAIVILSFLAAMMTPPDPLSMLMMIIPLVGLYEISVILVGIWGQKKPEAEAFE